MMKLDSNAHSVFLLHYHLVLVVKYRRKVFDDAISNRAKDIFEYISPTYKISLLEWHHDVDHVHALFKAHPRTEISKFLNACKNRQIPSGYKLKSVTVSQSPTGKYFASILYEYVAEIKQVKPSSAIGLDFSMPELYVDSNGDSPKYPRFYRRMQAKLAKEQRKLSKRMKGGKNREKQRFKVAKLHERVANQRKDFLHKQSRQIANAYDAVCIEDLNMKAMAKSLNFGKSVSDNGWGMFTRILEYKLKEQGKHLIKIGKWFPSSKLCGGCGHINNELELKHRDWICPNCKMHHFRDVNAACNIRKEGLRLLA